MRQSIVLRNINIRKLSQELFSSLKDSKNGSKVFLRVEDSPDALFTNATAKKSVLFNTIDKAIDSELNNNANAAKNDDENSSERLNLKKYVFYKGHKVKLDTESLANKLYSTTPPQNTDKVAPTISSSKKGIPVSLAPSFIDKYYKYSIKSLYDKSNVLEFKSQNPFLIEEDFFKLLRNLSTGEENLGFKSKYHKQLSVFDENDDSTSIKSKQFDHYWKMSDFQLIKKRDPKFLEFDGLYYLKFSDFPTACCFLADCTNELIEGLPATFTFFNVKSMTETGKQSDHSNMAIAQLGEFLHVNHDLDTNSYIVSIKNESDVKYRDFIEKGLDPKNLLVETLDHPEKSSMKPIDNEEVASSEKAIIPNNVKHSQIQKLIKNDVNNPNLQKFNLKTTRNHCAVVYNLPYVLTFDDLLVKIFWEFDLFPNFQNSLILLNKDPKVWLVIFDNDKDPKRFQRAYHNKWWNGDKTHAKVFVDVLDY